MKSLSTAFRHIALASVASVCLALPLGSATQADTGTGASGSSTAPAASDGPSSSTEEVHPTGVDANGNRLSDLQLRKNPSLRTYSGNAAGLYPMKRTGDSPDSVIPPDQRTRVNPTTGYPDRAIVYITKDDRHHCSGWMVSADTLVTAGHCLYNRGGKAWYTNLKFFPGANGNVRPYGFATATQLWTDVNYTRSGDTRQDWGVVKLNRRIGDTTGWFGLRWQAQTYNGTTATVRGYPGDKPHGQMWTMSGKIEDSQPNKLCYSHDTFGGQSGSPIYLSNNTVIGIHTNGVSRFGLCPKRNAGTRITQGLFSVILNIAR